jgi:4-hydroxybenzoate polyprenyltransferase
LKSIIRLTRVYQWTKSGFIFLPFIFSDWLFVLRDDPFSGESLSIVVRLAIAFFAFSFMASAVYVMNDLKDVELDRNDPRKRHRPIASGAISPATAFLYGLLLFAMGGALSYYLSGSIFAILIGYFVLNIFYTYVGKRVIILDVMIIAIGYVLRVLVGAEALDIFASPWLLSTTFFIALFLGFNKRYFEVSTSPPERLYGGFYQAATLKSFSSITATLSIVNYSIYTILGPHSEANLIWTVPLVVLGIFRYYVLMQSPEEVEDGNPSDLLLSDRFLILTISVWMLLCALLILRAGPVGPGMG